MINAARSASASSQISTTVLDLSRAIPAQAQKALIDGTAKMLGKDALHSPPPVRNFQSFPHFKVQNRGVDVATTAYVIKGTVYARQQHASGGFDVWFNCGRAPQAPAL